MDDLQAYNRPTLQHKNSVFRLVNWLIRLDVSDGKDCKSLIQVCIDQRTQYDGIRHLLSPGFDGQSSQEKLSSDPIVLSPAAALHGYRQANYWNTFTSLSPMPDMSTVQKYLLMIRSSLYQCVYRDIFRTHSDRAFFQNPSTHRMMERIIFIWMHENKRSDGLESYQQGMNELLAVICKFLVFVCSI
jgi:hypothetical protein